MCSCSQKRSPRVIVTQVERDSIRHPRRCRDFRGGVELAASRIARDCASFHASACSRPPEPRSRIFMPQFRTSAADDAGLVAKSGPATTPQPLTISEISALLKRTVEDRFGFVRLRGELSGVKRAASGHFYCA
jgi:hypothetical protein